MSICYIISVVDIKIVLGLVIWRLIFKILFSPKLKKKLQKRIPINYSLKLNKKRRVTFLSRVLQSVDVLHRYLLRQVILCFTMDKINPRHSKLDIPWQNTARRI